MLKVIATQVAFSGFSSIIPYPNCTMSPREVTAQVNRRFFSPFHHFLSLFLVMPLMASLLNSL